MGPFPSPPPEEFTQLLNPEGKSILLRVEDSPQRLVVRPAGVPLWGVVLSVTVVLGVLACVLTWRAFGPGLDSLEIAGIFFAPCAAVGCVAFFHAFNSYIESKGTFFILDKQPRTLALPRTGLVLQEPCIVGFIEVHAWHTTGDRWGQESSWLGELTVLTRGEDGRLSRFSVVVNDYSEYVSRMGKLLADFYHVPRLVVTRGWLLGIRQRLIEPGPPKPPPPPPTVAGSG
jgi:hypothetical protein